MSESNKRKTEQLGMPHGTARNRLIKQIMFSLMVETGKNICFQCGAPILTEDEMSIEHKTPWLHSGRAPELFFDNENIAFSHRTCNYGAARKFNKVYASEKERSSAAAKRKWAAKTSEERKADRRMRYLKEKQRKSNQSGDC